MNAAEIYYAQRDGVLILKLVGAIRIACREANRSSAALEAFIRRLAERKDLDQVVVDLTAATIIDSTYLGLLAQLAQFAATRLGRRPTILSPNQDLNTILECVGFDQVFDIVPALSPTPRQLERLEPIDTQQLEQAQLILRAHRALAKLNPTNEEQFRSVIELLDEELQKQRSDCATMSLPGKRAAS